MPAAIDVDREQVRMLVLSVGCREAARQMGLNEDTVSAWSARGGWLAHITNPAPPGPKPASMIPASSASKSAVDALQEALTTLSGKTKLGLLKASAKAAEALAAKDGESLLGLGAEAKAWADTGARAGNWADASASSVKIAIFGAAESPIIDV